MVHTLPFNELKTVKIFIPIINSRWDGSWGKYLKYLDCGNRKCSNTDSKRMEGWDKQSHTMKPNDYLLVITAYLQ